MASVIACVVVLFGISNQKEHLQEINSEREQVLADREAIVAVTRSLEDSQHERESLTTRILKEEDVIDFLTSIESIGKDKGVSFKTNSLTVQKINDTFESLVVDIGVRGQYASVLYVLKILEHIPYQSSIGSVQIHKEEGGEYPVWSGTIKLNVTKFKKT
ncbi:MAG: type 4a pilus biogenesis protein PilO [Candidatus Pacebacteria bacterium]|nr:type 4a pilus biogenesis protein PilO [Candidatus Paceibacterota bacterium]